MSAWMQFDEDADKVLGMTLAGTMDDKNRRMTTITYNMGMNRFGREKRHQQQ
jgi:hypothetical protein